MDAHGRVFMLRWANDWYLGATIDTALIRHDRFPGGLRPPGKPVR
jgi:hypothetical protein